MALDSHAGADDDFATPPSFVPAATHHKRSTDPADTVALPPSFTPSGSGESGKPTMTPRSEQTPAGGQPNVESRPPRRVGGSSKSLHSPVSGSTGGPAAGTASHGGQPSTRLGTSGRSTAPSFRPGAGPASGPTGSSRPVSNRPGLGSSVPGATAGTKTKTAKRHHPVRITLTIFIALLAIIAILLTMTYSWAGGQLHHFNGLSNRASDSSETWLITGSDARDGTAGTGNAIQTPGERTDSIMLLVKPAHGAKALISIPRDSLVNLDGKDMKINAVSELHGWKALTQTVEGLTGLKVDHLVRIGFGGLEKVVNAVGGVQLCYDRSFTDEYAGLTWQAGCHQVNGATALAFSRARYSDPKGDFGRTERQRMVIQAIAKKAASKDTLLNFSKAKNLTSSALAAISVDEKASPLSLLGMALAFRDATGPEGISGTLYYTNPNYYPPSGVGSTILLDKGKDLSLFQAIADGTQPKGAVGGLVQ